MASLNNDLVLSRARNVGQTGTAPQATYGRVEEVISPRILRIGARLTF